MNSPLTLESPAVLKHIDIYQALINRMAANSAACKQWAITLVSAILVFALDKGPAEIAIIALIPALMFCFLDAYYLSLERKFRGAYSSFLDKLHGNTLSINELYRVNVDKKLPTNFLSTLLSWSVWPFYLGMMGLALLGVVR
jgi:hypothetical protein